MDEVKSLLIQNMKQIRSNIGFSQLKLAVTSDNYFSGMTTIIIPGLFTVNYNIMVLSFLLLVLLLNCNNIVTI